MVQVACSETISFLTPVFCFEIVECNRTQVHAHMLMRSMGLDSNRFDVDSCRLLNHFVTRRHQKGTLNQSFRLWKPIPMNRWLFSPKFIETCAVAFVRTSQPLPHPLLEASLWLLSYPLFSKPFFTGHKQCLVQWILEAESSTATARPNPRLTLSPRLYSHRSELQLQHVPTHHLPHWIHSRCHHPMDLTCSHFADLPAEPGSPGVTHNDQVLATEQACWVCMEWTRQWI